MRRDDPRVDRLYGVIHRIRAALRAGSPKTANDISEGALREPQDKAYDGWAHDPRDQRVGPWAIPERVDKARTPKARERARHRLFTLCDPATILRPVNVVAVYLRDHPMWAAWDFDATRGCNAPRARPERPDPR